MKRICLSASMRFKSQLVEAMDGARAAGVEALFPNLDIGVSKTDLTPAIVQKLCWDEFAAIDRAEALYVLNPGGYIGTLVKIEIGYALGRRKPVYFSEVAGAIELDTLCAGVVPLAEIARFAEL